MARAYQEDLNQHFIICPVCYVQFNDEENKPKLLCCSHAVCLQCLKKIVDHGHGSISCPVCRQHNRCDKGVDQLPTSQHVLHIIKLDEQLRFQRWTAHYKTSGIEPFVKELLDNFSPDEKPFFEELRHMVEFIVDDSTRSLSPVWKLQDTWKDKPTAVSKLYQTITNCVVGMSQVHMDYLITDIQARWVTSDNIGRAHLLDFAHGLAHQRRNEDITAQIADVVGGFMSCADTPDELIDMCIEKLKKILSDGWTCDLFSHWLLTCSQTIQAQQKLAAPAMKLLRHLCYLFAVKKAAQNKHYQNSNEFNQLVLLNYKEIYVYIDQEWQLFGHAIAGLVTYMMGCSSAGNPDIHTAAVQERLAFLCVFLKYGEMYMDESAAASIWMCLVDGAVFNSDPAICFEWFAKVIEMPMMETKAIRRIYHQHILKLDPRRVVNQSAFFMDCFEHFFQAVQCSNGDIVNEDITDPLPGLDFLWKLVQYADIIIAQRAFELLKETVIYLDPKLLFRRLNANNDVIIRCLETCKNAYFSKKMQTGHLLMLSDHLSLMECLAKCIDKEDMPVPRRFLAINFTFTLTVTKRGRPSGQILIKPSPRFGSPRFVQELRAFCYANPRKMGRSMAKSTTDAFVSLKMKNAMFQPVVPDMLSYRIWLDSDGYAQKACQVGITGIRSTAGRGGRRVTGWQFVFLLRDMVPGAHQSNKSLLFGTVVQGIDVVKSLNCSGFLTSNFSDGLRLTLESAQ